MKSATTVSREVVLIDAGGSNLGSVDFALRRLGVEARITADHARIRAASHVILPGVGAAANGMQRLRDSGVDQLLPTLIQPVLGICLGMQLLADYSEEGDVACLGIVSGVVRRLSAAPDRRVPHMGWNRLQRLVDDPLLAGLSAADSLYFVHGYALDVGACTLASVDYGNPFSALVRRGNFCGMQFHPERSASAGSRLLANVLRLGEPA
ncbi:MAG: imidazole glycerol phosphate synthase subunit HisH [Dokdonella sp.]